MLQRLCDGAAQRYHSSNRPSRLISVRDLSQDLQGSTRWEGAGGRQGKAAAANQVEFPRSFL
eukprot:2719567-Rhodomonas_salina.1